MESSASREARGESEGKFPAHREERLMDNKHDKELRASAEKPASDKEETMRKELKGLCENGSALAEWTPFSALLSIFSENHN